MSDSLTVPFSDLRSTADGFDPQLDEFFSYEENLTYELRWPQGNSTRPGVLIYISPKPGAGLPEGWTAVLDEHNLIWVGAHNSGNEVHVARRVGMAQLGAVLAAQSGAIDPDKIILSGFSGGGRVASMMIPAYPRHYCGALFICGANPMFTATQETLDSLHTVPLVFLTGEHDFNLEDTRMAIVSYQQAGLTNTHLFEIEGLEHALPDARGLDQALKLIQRT